LNENSNIQYVYDEYSNRTSNTAYIGSSATTKANDPQRSSDGTGMIFETDNIISFPSLPQGSWSISTWIKINQLQSCLGKIFTRMNITLIYTQIYLEANSSNLMMAVNDVRRFDLGINLGTSQWSFFVLVAGAYGARTYLNYRSVTYWPPTNTITRRDSHSKGVEWKSPVNDIGYIGDMTCSFLGQIKNIALNFGTNTSNLFINIETCQTTTHSLLYLGMDIGNSISLLNDINTLCPSDKFYDSRFLSCQSCPMYCATCSNWTFCSSCTVNYTLNEEKMCTACAL
jgi:hypothetical protein